MNVFVEAVKTALKVKLDPKDVDDFRTQLLAAFPDIHLPDWELVADKDGGCAVTWVSSYGVVLYLDKLREGWYVIIPPVCIMQQPRVEPGTIQNVVKIVADYIGG